MPSATGKAHIGDVVFAQIDLRRAASALDQNDVGVALHDPKAFKHVRQQLRLHILHLARRRRVEHFALHDHLRADLALGFQQHRVHMHGRRNTSRERLQRLRPPDLAAIFRDSGIVRHVLRLEWPDGEAAPRECPAKTRDEQRLADARPRALQHKGADAHQYSMPACAFTPAEK
jgi:hypothetical protein